MAGSLDADGDHKRKRQRPSSIPENAGLRSSENKDGKQARVQVREIFGLWEQVHGGLGESVRMDALNTKEVLKTLQNFKHDIPGKLALAACWKGITEKVGSTVPFPVSSADLGFLFTPAHATLNC
jgi:hypothetical protein